MINWDMLNRAPDIGQAVQQGIQMGAQLRQRQNVGNALAAYAKNPDDPAAAAGVTAADPMIGMRVQEDQRRRMAERRELEKAAEQERAKVFGHAAQLADNPEKWDSVVDHFAPQYPEITQYKGKFDPGLRAALMARAGLKEDRPDPTSLERNFEFLKARDPKLANMYLQNYAEGPPIMVDNGDGTKTLIPRASLPGMVGGGGQEDIPTVADPTEAKKLPPGTQFRTPDGRLMRVPGGASQSGSPTFPQP